MKHSAKILTGIRFIRSSTEQVLFICYFNCQITFGDSLSTTSRYLPVFTLCKWPICAV